MAMARRCNGKWRITLSFDVSNKKEHGGMSIGTEDDEGNFDGEHLDDGNPTVKMLRKGKCKNDKIHFEREHKDGGVIVHDGSVISDKKMEGRFEILASDSRAESQGGESKNDRKDKKKDKKKDPGDTGTWTGVKEGL